MIHFTKISHSQDVNGNGIDTYMIFDTITKKFTKFIAKGYGYDIDKVEYYTKINNIKGKVI